MNCYSEIMKFLLDNELLENNALIICESAKETLIDCDERMEVYKEKEYGIKKVVIYRKRGDVSEF